MATSTATHDLSSFLPDPSSPLLAAMVPPVPTPIPTIVDALRTITPLHGLADSEYEWLARNGRERKSETGTLLFREAEPATSMVMLLEGEIQVRRGRSGPMALFIGRAGQMSGKLPFSRMKGYGGDGYSNGPAWVLDIHESLFPAMLQAIPSMAQRCVNVLLDRTREITRMEQQAEKLAALGKLAGNLAHELNNPASAAQRTAASLFAELRDYGDRKYALGAMCLERQTCDQLGRWIVKTRAEVADYIKTQPSPQDGPLANVDREAQILAWLEKHNVPDAWSIAPTLAESSFPLEYLDRFAAEFPQEIIPATMGTFASSLRVERMAETIINSTVRIFDLISAIKDYSYMDQAPIQDVDLAQSLESTLTMFASRFSNIRVRTDFAPDLPPVSVYGSEINQVWTSLIENALDAMPDGGTLTLCTRLSGEMALVEVRDTGIGISPELTNRVFEPFFTTKAPGRGLGLGLDTVQRIVTKHSGFVRLESKPGETLFQVRLPLDRVMAY